MAKIKYHLWARMMGLASAVLTLVAAPPTLFYEGSGRFVGYYGLVTAAIEFLLYCPWKTLNQLLVLPFQKFLAMAVLQAVLSIYLFTMPTMFLSGITLLFSAFFLVVAHITKEPGTPVDKILADRMYR